MPTPESFSHYQILEQIGVGGMSVVYRARDTLTSEIVALKVLHPYLAQKNEYKNRLIREAQTTSSLDHPCILKIIDFECDEDKLFLVTEFVSGMTLKEFANKHELWNTPEISALIICEIAQALEYAHRHGVIHRDIKPDNIMVTIDGHLKLMDFGIAHLSDEESLTVTGAMVGSPAHMAPELVDGHGCDARADIFSLGTVFYWLVTGALPFDGPNHHAVLRNVLEGNYRSIEELSGRVLPELQLIIEKAMATKPKDRYETAHALAEAIRSALKFITDSRDSIQLADLLAKPEEAFEKFGQDVRVRALEAAKRQLTLNNLLPKTAFLNRVLADEPFDMEALRLLEQSGEARSPPKSKIVIIASCVLAIASAFEIVVVTFDTDRSESAIAAPSGVEQVLADTQEAAQSMDARDPKPQSTPPQEKGPKTADSSARVSKTKISVTPYADIWIDGRMVARNTTALEVLLDPGRHHISFKHQYATTEDRTVQVSSGAPPAEIHVDLERVKPASLSISSDIDADVAIDGIYKGTTTQSQTQPIRISFPKKAFTRKLEVVVSQRGYHPYVGTHIITPGKKQSINIKLEPEPS